MNNTLLDNSEKFLMRDVLKKSIASGKYNHICIATGYWDLPGTALVYDELKSFLEKGGRLDILIGQEPQLRSYQKQVPDSDQERFPDFYLQRDINLLSDEYRPTAELILRYCKVHKYEPKIKESLFDFVDDFENQDDSQIQIRVYGQENPVRKQFLHAKCYIFLNQEEGEADGIIGSSNFTKKGLEDNAELNYLETNNQVVASDPSPYIKSKSHKTWFDEKWEQSVPWNGQFLQILTSAPIGQPEPVPEPEQPEESVVIDQSPLSPYELYIKYLHTYFGDLADVNIRKQLESYLPEGKRAIGYQMEAVEQCLHIMQQHNGFFLADVVGLGKTLVGALVIRKFLEEAESYNREPNVLIITPPAVRSNWEDIIRDFDKQSTFKMGDYIDLKSSGGLTNLDEDIASDIEDEDIDDLPTDKCYGLIIIDESHNFRNSETRKYKVLKELIESITLQGEQPFVGLLSATPQNNSPRDLKNQIYLFELEPNRSSFTDVEGRKLDSFFADKEKKFKKLRNDNSKKAKEELRKISNEIRTKVLDHIVVRRTRRDITKYFPEDAAKLKFPTIKGPNKLEYKMDGQLAQLFYDTMFTILPIMPDDPIESQHLGYYRYSAIAKLRDKEMRRLYEKRNLTVAGISTRLATIMQVLLVKRLESSFSAFIESLENLQTYTHNMIEMMKYDQVFICPDGIDVNKVFADCNNDVVTASAVLHDKIKKKGGKNRCFRASDFESDYLELLKKDEQLISNLVKRWYNEFREDPKLAAFTNELESTLFNKKINNPHGYDKQKLVIFTEAKATQAEIDKICKSYGHRPLLVNSENRKDLENTIRENFDAMYQTSKDDYDIIVTTEVLAEGVNLHRANVVLNYDIPWNATKLMQRIGRVNRIGSKEDFVHVYNFSPTANGNQYIKLVEKAYAKLQAFHTMFGEDNQIYSDQEEISEANFNHQFEGEESPFAPFMADLKRYKEENPERFNYICSLPLENVGGQLLAMESTSKFIVTTEKRHNIHILIDENNEGLVVSPLAFMKALKCETTDTFNTVIDSDRYNSLSEITLRTYNQHVTHNLKPKDISKRSLEAQKILDAVRTNLTTEEAKNALKNADRACRNGNSVVIDVILKHKDELLDCATDLWGADESIDLWVNGMFGKLRQRVEKENGKASIGLYEI